MLDDKIVFEYCSDVIVLINHDGKVLSFNKKAESIFHLQATNILGLNFFETIERYNIIVPFSFEDLRALRKKQPHLIEGNILLHHPSMKKYHLKWTIYKQVSNKSKKGLFTLIGEDISETENYKTSLRDSRLYLSSIIENLPQYVYWKDKNLVYQGCNNLVAQYLGLESAAEIIGKTDGDFQWSKTRINFLHKIDETILKDGITNIVEDEIPKEDGTIGIMLTSKAPLRNENEEIVGIVGISFDITDRKNIERELQQAKVAAESASRAKSEFIANMSHDIRTPITGILGLTQELIDKADQTLENMRKTQSIENKQDYYLSLLNKLIEITREDGQLVLGSTDELLQLLNEILETMSLESGKKTEQAESFNLKEIIKHNIEIMHPVARHKQLKLEYEYDETLPVYVKGLRHYLDRTLLNLLSNALKFTEKGFVKIKVQRSNSQQLSFNIGDSVSLTITVEDSGIGIPEDKFETIFEHFSRLTPSYQGIYKGAGLGLYTVKHYIDAMQATIKVESETGQGSRFIIRLPLTVSDHSDREKISYRAPAKESVLPIQPIAYTQQNMDKISANAEASVRILLVEDNPIAARGARATISRLYDYCACDLAETGTEAIKLAQNNSYDFILMDIGLPDIDGIEVTRQIRALRLPIQPPIIALTGHASDCEKREEAMAAGMQEVFEKPLTVSKIESVMQNYVFKPKQDEVSDKASSSKEILNTSSIIDWGQCIQQFNGDETTVRELLASLAIDLKQSQEKVAKLYIARDEDALRAELHRINGGIVYFSLPQLTQARTDFHEAVKAKPQDTKELEKTYVLFQEAIANFLVAQTKLGSNT